MTVLLNEAIAHATEKKMEQKTNLLCVRILLTELFRLEMQTQTAGKHEG